MALYFDLKYYLLRFIFVLSLACGSETGLEDETKTVDPDADDNSCKETLTTLPKLTETQLVFIVKES